MASLVKSREEVASGRLCDLREHCELPFVPFILTEAAKHTCKLVCGPQRVDEKEFSKTSPLRRGRKKESMKENEETQGNQTKQYA